MWVGNGDARKEMEDKINDVEKKKRKKEEKKKIE